MALVCKNKSMCVHEKSMNNRFFENFYSYWKLPQRSWMDNSISKKFQRRYFHLFWNDLRSDINFQLLLPHLPGISETPPNVDTLQTFQYQKNCLHKFPKNLIKNWYFLVFLKLPHINALQMLQRSWMTVSPKNSTNYFHPVSKWLHKFPKNSITPNTSWHFRNSPKCPSNVIDSIITKKFHLRSPTREPKIFEENWTR